MREGFTLAGEIDLLLPITGLLPLTSLLLVSQNNPYQTLVLRGILGSLATLLYALLGAPDVALTEALVGTLLSTTLYAVALRSSMVLRLSLPEAERLPEQRLRVLREWLEPLHLRLLLHTAGEPGDGDPGAFHGWIEEGHRLVLVNPRLVDRLRGLDGFRSWQACGGTLQRESPG